MERMKKLKMAIVGHGFVGAAVDYGFPDSNCNKTIIDPKYGTQVSDLIESEIEIAFVCVPTPMGQDASIDASILVSAVNDLLAYTNSMIVIKSTVIPSIIGQLAKDSRVIYNPEFLTEKAANEDFVNPIMHVFGGDSEQTEKLEKIYTKYSACKPCAVYHMTAEEASFVKYGMNSFLASKVLFFNQFYDVIEQYGGNYSTIIKAIGTDKRIGSSHTMVPGHDGRKGYGSACFAKDVPAFVKFARSIGKDFTVLKEVAIVNQDIRNSYGEPLPREKEQHVRFDYDI
jgi:UDPglucose 6-dehydrogenase